MANSPQESLDRNSPQVSIDEMPRTSSPNIGRFRVTACGLLSKNYISYHILISIHMLRRSKQKPYVVFHNMTHTLQFLRTTVSCDSVRDSKYFDSAQISNQG